MPSGPKLCVLIGALRCFVSVLRGITVGTVEAAQTPTRKIKHKQQAPTIWRLLFMNKQLSLVLVKVSVQCQ